MNTALKGLFAFLLLGIAVTGASAFGGFHSEEAREALENEDYEAFVQVAEDEGRPTERLTEERFGNIVQGYQSHETAKQAVVDQDYDAWVAAIENKPKRPEITEIITEDNFATFAALHQARQDGDKETAKSLAEELGLDEFGPRHHGRRGHRFGNRGDGPRGDQEDSNQDRPRRGRNFGRQ
ncbi:MAG: hypothetical protein QF486_00525 [Candidatus Woesearchaeota archaeon]|jgi:hypothetical protein|nr:hypothetical protein [Candidatus Woesearchaeota archaeon]MDP7181292.1 hypothetical protein [Candidatus Woesearchaeota archaeon]MDP7198089.1 hypothetical protein [Candidatus Woesearchaeota archaeon]MDP7466923.1 hypothetical protein [Candidatus Woesearchaeota archaeon]MDP7647358.1 hypothetical protein [Candidatus Woesearchaeota archaeon]|tara:strand:- start:126 stop:668 length:543 start_codon:yes stop_codon:yes gene_type:complete